jgi:hypothetical protein
VKGYTMNAELRVVPSAEPQPDFFTLALLLAEGQTGDVEEHWGVFVDNLSRISDAFARARSGAKAKAPEEAIVTV